MGGDPCPRCHSMGPCGPDCPTTFTVQERQWVMRLTKAGVTREVGVIRYCKHCLALMLDDEPAHEVCSAMPAGMIAKCSECGGTRLRGYVCERCITLRAAARPAVPR